MNFNQILWSIGGTWLVLYPAFALWRAKPQRSTRITFRVGNPPRGVR